MFPVPGMTLTAGNDGSGMNKRVVDNLANGIYAMDEESCFFGSNSLFILVTLPTEQTISYVIFRTQPEGFHFHNKFENVEVRVGNRPSTFPYSDYEILGTYIGEPASLNIDIRIEGPSLTGKFVSVVKTSGAHMQVCFMEIH